MTVIVVLGLTLFAWQTKVREQLHIALTYTHALARTRARIHFLQLSDRLLQIDFTMMSGAIFALMM